MASNQEKYASPTVVSLGTLANSTRAVKEQPPADGINLTETGTTPGEPPPNGNGIS